MKLLLSQNALYSRLARLSVYFYKFTKQLSRTAHIRRDEANFLQSQCFQSSRRA